MVTEIFLQRFKPVVEAWGASRFPIAVLERIQFKTQDLSESEMRALCERILDTCDHAPSSAKVNEHANFIRSRREQKSSSVSQAENCSACLDLGIVRVEIRAENTFTLMRCSCKEGSNYGGNLPQWQKILEPDIVRSPCPLDWFKPDKPVRGEPIHFQSKAIADKISAWKFRKQVAEDYWARTLGVS